jgi:Ca-activated chloride channel homolog
MNKFRLSNTIFATVFGLMLSAGALAQTATPTPTTRLEDQEIKIESRLVVIPVSVTDAAGNPVTGLGKNDFSVIEEGKRQVVDNVGSADVVPLEIALLFDVSASTDAMFRFQQETAAKFLSDVMKPIDRATIFTIGAAPKLIQARDTAQASAISVRSVQPTKEQTAFYDSLKAATEHLRKNAPQTSRKVMVVISDGEDTNSEGVLSAIWKAERNIADNVQGAELRALRVKARDTAKAQEQAKVLKILQDADTVFYSINPAGSSYQLNQMSQFGQDNMERFARETGGSSYLPKFQPIDTPDSFMNASNMKRNTATLETIFRQLANELRAQYLVQYYSDAEFAEGRFVKLDVKLSNPGSNRLRARQGYYVKN